MRTHLGTVLAILAIFIVGGVVATSRPQVSEFGGEGSFTGTVLVCRPSHHCTRFRPAADARVMVVLRRTRSGSPASIEGKFGLGRDGTVGGSLRGGTYFARLEPATIGRLTAGTVMVRLSTSKHARFTLAYR